MTIRLSLILLKVGFIFASCTAYSNDSICNSIRAVHIPKIDVDVVIFGELHGNKESPEVFLAAVCQYLSQAVGEIRVALELPSEIQTSLDVFLESNGDRIAVQGFLGHPFWQRTSQDGRSSQAMLHLIEALREIKVSTRRMASVTAIDGKLRNRSLLYNNVTRGGIMAANVTSLSQESDGDVVFVLVGNIHARRTAPAGLSFLTPAASLVDADFVTVRILPETGESWNCQGPCQTWPVHEVSSLHDLEDRVRAEGSFDYLLPIGRVHSSPPANLPFNAGRE